MIEEHSYLFVTTHSYRLPFSGGLPTSPHFPVTRALVLCILFYNSTKVTYKVNLGLGKKDKTCGSQDSSIRGTSVRVRNRGCWELEVSRNDEWIGSDIMYSKNDQN